METAKVVIVTGGTYGIGRAITVTLAERGYRVIAFGLEEKQPGSTAQMGIEGTRAELNKRNADADLLIADVSKGEEVRSVVEFAARKYARIDALVNNAAIRVHGKVMETSEETWDRVMAVNLKGTFLATKAVLPYMLAQGKGAIVNISSASGWGRPNRVAYCASKSGVFGFSAALASDHLDEHIRVNVVVPGYTLTGMTESEGGTTAAKNASGRALVPRDTANAVAFLLSEEAETISGSVITVGGPLLSSRAL